VGRAHLVEALEDALPLGDRQPRPFVLHPQADVGPGRRRRDADAGVGGRVLGGVLDQVDQDLLDEEVVQEHRGEGHGHRRLDAVIGQHRAEAGDGVVHELAEGVPLPVEHQGPGLDSGEVEEVAHQAVEAIRLALDLGGEGEAGAVVPGDVALEEAAGRRLDRRQGAPQIVRDGREEGGPQGVRPAQHLGLDGLPLQPAPLDREGEVVAGRRQEAVLPPRRRSAPGGPDGVEDADGAPLDDQGQEGGPGRRGAGDGAHQEPSPGGIADPDQTAGDGTVAAGLPAGGERGLAAGARTGLPAGFAAPGRRGVGEDPHRRRLVVPIQRRAPQGLEAPAVPEQHFAPPEPQAGLEALRRLRQARLHRPAPGEGLADLVQQDGLPLAPVGLLRPLAEEGRQVPGHDGGEEEEEEGLPFVWVGDVQGVGGLDEEPVEGDEAEHGGQDRRPPSDQGPGGQDGDQVDGGAVLEAQASREEADAGGDQGDQPDRQQVARATVARPGRDHWREYRFRGGRRDSGRTLDDVRRRTVGGQGPWGGAGDVGP
jgi:hypothetical protein